ncbi:MAG: hypothetical protein CL920_08270 [Deltaproteobacteria bacterium]|mgnify:CR=1 FL=1|nr:hypothetical protein [Deltaproteobacteria bacterium]MBU48675.1 hypothetical protein [Deltaproteobacteria bacterium]
MTSLSRTHLLYLCILAAPVCAILVYSQTLFTNFTVFKDAAVWSLLFVSCLLWRPRFAGGVWLWSVWGLFFGYMCLSLLWSHDPGRGFSLAMRSVACAVWALFALDWFAQRRLEEREQYALYMAFIVLCAGGLSALWGVAQYIGLFQTGTYTLIGTIGNPNRLAGALLLCLPALWWCLAEGQARWFRWLSGIAGGLCCAGIWLSRCQSAILSLALMCAVGLLLEIMTRAHLRAFFLQKLLAWSSVLFVSSGLFVMWIVLKWGSILHSLRGRFWVGFLSTEVWMDSFWRGVGVGGYPHAIANVQGKILQKTSKSWMLLMDPHNQLLDILSQLGLFGLVVFVWLVCIVARRILRGGVSRSYQKASCVALIGVACYSLSETPSMSMPCVLFVGCWLVWGQLHTLQVKDGAGAKAEYVWMVLMIFVASGMWSTVRTAYGDLLLGRGMKAAARGTKDGMERAEQFYTRALQHVSEKGIVLFSRGLVRRELGRQKAALSDLRASFVFVPSPERALAIAGIHFSLGQMKKAVEWGEKSLALHPRYVRAYHNMGVFFLEQKRSYDAWRYLRKARSMRPGDKRMMKAWARLPRHLRMRGPVLR